MEKTSSF
jgi:hypothetical protein